MILSWAPETSYNPMLWAYISILVRVRGAITVYLRVHLKDSIQTSKRNLWSILKFHTSQEFRLSSSHTKATISLRPEDDLFLALSWITSTGTVIHFSYGTFVLSGALSIGSANAVVVVSRLLLLTVVSKAILMYGMSGMRPRVETDGDGE